jgi:FKBP-type peptidyl-prolyl cis-trans isomerase FkpA
MESKMRIAYLAATVLSASLLVACGTDSAKQELSSNDVGQSAAKENDAYVLGTAFLAENALKENVIVTDSGLQYKVIRQGEGSKPSARDRVTVHYKGTLIDGTEFDSSYSRGEPSSFPLNRVIPGWTEGLQLMKTGAKYRFYIPSELAYGARTNGKIKANSTLIFDVELIEINS